MKRKERRNHRVRIEDDGYRLEHCETQRTSLGATIAGSNAGTVMDGDQGRQGAGRPVPPAPDGAAAYCPLLPWEPINTAVMLALAPVLLMAMVWVSLTTWPM